MDSVPDASGIGTFRRGVEADAATLAAFAARTFQETFAHSTSSANMDAHLAAAYGVEQQGRELRDPGSATLLLEHEGVLVAFAQVRRKAPPIEVPYPRVIELQRFYVDVPWHGRGVAQRLMAAAKGAARELGGEWLWLSVWEGNARAIAFYAKAGYVDAGGTEFWLGPDRQFDRVMVAPLG
ncbi:MAG: GNAT family N-acetyltransferase [Cytophagaceae bacterium]|nr:GNAT family N-acetyltransferase [Gemmatimonadaceae bacterium]